MLKMSLQNSHIMKLGQDADCSVDLLRNKMDLEVRLEDSFVLNS
jgi:hypothetical protein